MLSTSNPRTALRHLQRSRCLLKRLVHNSIVPEHCDVLVVGGGPAGLAFAAALGVYNRLVILFYISNLLKLPSGSSHRVQESLRVVLVEASDLSKVKQWSLPEGYSNRVSSITNASRGFLRGELVASDRI